jgi:multicomponent Na+:H+ antiporter subunit G
MMAYLQNGLSILAIVSGLFFLLVGSIGLIRFPDFYARSHATAKTDMLGIMLMLFGLFVYEGFTLGGAKLLIAMVFIGLAAPIATHALAKAAWDYGLRPWFPGDPQAGPAKPAKKKKGAR